MGTVVRQDPQCHRWATLQLQPKCYSCEDKGLGLQRVPPHVFHQPCEVGQEVTGHMLELSDRREVEQRCLAED